MNNTIKLINKFKRLNLGKIHNNKE